MNRGYGVGTGSYAGVAVGGPGTGGEMWFDGNSYVPTLNDTYARIVWDTATSGILITDAADVDRFSITYSWVMPNQVYTVAGPVTANVYGGSIVALDTATYTGTVTLPNSLMNGDTYIIKDVGGNASVNNITVVGAGVTFGLTGVSNGTPTFIDTGANFPVDFKRAWVNIASGPAAGSYRIVSVDSSTQLTLDASVPADSPVTYTIAWGIDDAFSLVMNTNFDWHNLTFFPGYGWYST